MLFASNQKGMSNAYLFWIGTLLFGLPLMSSYYAIQTLSDYALVFLFPYVVVSIVLGLLILRFTKVGNADIHANLLVRKNERISGALPYLALSFATLAVVSFGMMKYLVASTYPTPNQQASLAGGSYLITISLAVALGFPFVVSRLFPIVRKSLSISGNFRLAIASGILYFFTYMLLVNQILVTGFNTSPGNFVSSPTGIYPYMYVFTFGPPPAAFAESLIYVPYVLVQLNEFFNLIFQPFEVVFAIVISTMVGATVAVTRYLISNRGHSCYTGATVSGIGGFLGFTATCPSCLAPTLISVLSGGFSAGIFSLASIQAAYSTLYGVLVPPLFSITALLIALFLLDVRSKNQETHVRNHRKSPTNVMKTETSN